jgi:hypothetical protein
VPRVPPRNILARLYDTPGTSDQATAAVVRVAIEWHTVSVFPPEGGDARHEGQLTLAAVADQLVGHAGEVFLPLATTSADDVLGEVTVPVAGVQTLVDQLEAGFLAAEPRAERLDRH